MAVGRLDITMSNITSHCHSFNLFLLAVAVLSRQAGGGHAIASPLRGLVN